MARRYLGYGITNSNGVATLDHDPNGNALTHSYTGVGAGELDIVAESGTLQSEAYELWDYIKCDINNSLNVSDYTLRYDADSLTATDNYKIFSTSESSGRRCYLPFGSLDEYKITLEVKYASGCTGNVGVSNTGGSTLSYGVFNNTDWVYVQIIQTGGAISMKTSTDGENWTNKSITSTTAFTVTRLMVTVANGSVSFRNIKVEPI